MAITQQKKTIGAVIGVGVVFALVIAMWAFQPWKVFTSTTVNEAAPSASPIKVVDGSASPVPSGSTAPVPQVGNVTLFAGQFQSYEHETTGTATVLRTADGQTVVRLSDFRTSDGPDVHVWLTDAPANKADAANTGKYVDLGVLKGNVGNQNYTVAPSAVADNWSSVVIWCERFSVPFGAAPLTPAAPTLR